jgi:hypothetical protein
MKKVKGKMMMKSIKNNVLAGAIVCSLYVPAHAIQSSTADICSGLVFGACAGGSGKLLYDNPALIHPAILGGASVIATGVAYYYLHQATPAGRLKRANVLLAELSRHKLARICFDNDREFFDAVHDVYLTDDLPLISAYNHLINLLPTMHYAFGLINKAAAEVGKDSLLQEECDSSLSRADMLFRNISDSVKRIREHKDYLPQLMICKEWLVSEKQTIAQEQIALAQVQMAEAQKSATFLKWLKAIFWGR